MPWLGKGFVGAIMIPPLSRRGSNPQGPLFLAPSFLIKQSMASAML
jgi:hypothetical protein